MMAFVARLRELSGGKPIGIKLCIGRPWEFLGICKAMLESGIYLDFVVIDGKEGGTGAAPEEFSDSVGMPLRDGLLFARNALVGLGLADRIRLGASGKIVTGFDMTRCFALGADWCNAARPFMFALGCVQSQRCHTDTCPTGVTTQDPWRQRGLVVSDKSARVARYHQETLKNLMDLIAAAGLDAPWDLTLDQIWRRDEHGRVTTLASLHPVLEPGELNDDARDPWYRAQWQRASAAAFSP
jgi:glutamate synthase domain-containing protein 2